MVNPVSGHGGMSGFHRNLGNKLRARYLKKRHRPPIEIFTPPVLEPPVIPPVLPPPPPEEELPPLFLNEGGQVPRKIYDPARMGFVDNPAYFAQPATIEESFGEPEEMVFEPKLPSGGPNTRTPIENLYGGLRQSFLPEISPNNDSAFVLPSGGPNTRTPIEGLYGGDGGILDIRDFIATYAPYSSGGKGGKGGSVNSTVTRLPDGKGGTTYGRPGLAPNQMRRRYMRGYFPESGGSATAVTPERATYGGI
jgi:hypothetical protein